MFPPSVILNRFRISATDKGKLRVVIFALDKERLLMALLLKGTVFIILNVLPGNRLGATEVYK